MRPVQLQRHSAPTSSCAAGSWVLPRRAFAAQPQPARPSAQGSPQRTATRRPLALPVLRVACQAATQANGGSSHTVADNSVSLVLLAGGVGKRMGAAIPKQYLELQGQPIATFSMQTFAAMPQVGEIVVVCEPEWRPVFEECYAKLPRKVPLKFAAPGPERQDSVFNGFQAIDPAAELVAIHDSARPLVTKKDTLTCFQDALAVGAAVLGVPVKPTIKEVDSEKRVVKTLQRAKLWEVQTPQVIRPALLREGFELVRRDGLEVTDDVSIIEALGRPVQITPGSYTNIKVTTPDDMQVAERFLDEQRAMAHAL